MSDLKQAFRDLVIANRVLAHENVCDAYGHISMRHPDRPDRYLLARSRSPQLVDESDIMEFTLDGKPVNDDNRPAYIERFIHGGIYESRPEVNSVIHAHAEDILPFSISTVKLEAVIAPGSDLGHDVPVWDIREKFGDATNLLVSNMEHGRDLAKRIADNSVCLMRGHGFAAAQYSIHEVVRTAIYLPRNARVQMAAMRLGGGINPLSFNEIETKKTAHGPTTPEAWRAWEYWAISAGCADRLGEPPKR